MFKLSIFTFNLIELLVLGWTYYNSKSSKSNRWNSRFRSKNSSIFCSLTFHILFQNLLFYSKDEIAKTNGRNNYTTFSLVLSQVPIAALVNTTIIKYFKNNIQRIIRLFWRSDSFYLLLSPLQRLFKINYYKLKPSTYTGIRIT